MKNVKVGLSYFKQGDDLNSCLETSDNNIEAFRKHAQIMHSCGKHLDDIADILKNFQEEDVTVEADTHCIWINGPEKVLNILVEKELAYESEWQDEEE